MLKRYMHNRERYFVMLNDNRIVREFDWGTEYLPFSANGKQPNDVFRENTRSILADSGSFFGLSEPINFDFAGDGLSWQSTLQTDWKENNTVRAKFFPYEKNKRSAVLILPHWNAKAGSYFDLCRLFNKVGISALRLTLPYHEERTPAGLERADYLVAPNVGLSLQSVRQAVLDTKAAILWLKEQGYEKVGIVGTSIGSCTAFLAFTHDLNIDAAVFNHVSGYFSDVVWNGLSTYHVREALEKEVSLEELREYWLPISPLAYMEKLAKMPHRAQRYIYTLYDLTFPVDLSRDTIKALRKNKIKFSKAVLPCGHYTLGEKPWVYLDGYKIVSFLKWHLR